MTRHDDNCENLPGGKYHGATLSDGEGIPCHCAAREAGRAKAARETHSEGGSHLPTCIHNTRRPEITKTKQGTIQCGMRNRNN